MRIRIKLGLEGKTISINYHSILQGIIYSAIGKDAFSKELHDVGNRKIENRPFKMFTFSELFGNFEFDRENKKIKFVSNGYFEVSAYDDDIILKIAQFLDMNSNVVFDDIIVGNNGYDIIDDYFKCLDKMTFITISPVVCNKTVLKRPRYISPEEDEYREMIKNNINKKYFLAFGKMPGQYEIDEITNIKMRKINFRNTFYICYDYKITFKDIDSNILSILMSSGIGSKNSMGFGMLRYEKTNLSL